MILDFSYDQVMRMSNVKRWGIITMSRQQSVAEHSYNVACIAMVISDEILKASSVWHDVDHQVTIDTTALLQWCLCHDLPEVVTGDIPTPLKRMVGDTIEQFEMKLFPDHYKMKKMMMESYPLEYAIYKVADYSDAIQFARAFCIDTKKEEIIREMVVRAKQVIGDINKKFLGDIMGNSIASCAMIDAMS